MKALYAGKSQVERQLEEKLEHVQAVQNTVHEQSQTIVRLNTDVAQLQNEKKQLIQRAIDCQVARSTLSGIYDRFYSKEKVRWLGMLNVEHCVP